MYAHQHCYAQTNITTDFVDTVVMRSGGILNGTLSLNIMLVHLSLQTVAPITVTYGGANPSQYNVIIELDGDQPQGTLTLTQLLPRSGAMSTMLPLIFKVRFAGTRPTDPQPLAPGVAGLKELLHSDQNTFQILKEPCQPVVRSINNAASFAAAPTVSPGEIVTLFGADMKAPSDGVLFTPASGKVSASLGGATVLFNSVPAPLLYVSATQINAIVPYEVASVSTAGAVSVAVASFGCGSPSDGLAAQVAATAPAIFSANASGTGQGAILNQNFSVNSPDNPAPSGSVIAIYATGEGLLTPSVASGTISGLTLPLPAPIADVTVTIGGQTAPISYAGEAPGLVSGVLQVNAQIPGNIGSGNQPVVLKIGDNANAQQGITVTVSGDNPTPAPLIVFITPGPTGPSGSTSLTVTGANFQPGLTATLTAPTGTATTISGSQLQFVSSTSIVLTTSLTATGNYRLQVTNPDGRASNGSSFTARAAAPAITGINPASPQVSTAAQTITVTGSGFQSGLTARLIGPGGTVSASVQNVSSSAFQIVAVLAAAGGYALQVTNSDGQVSNLFSFTLAAPTAAPPAITGIIPASPHVSSAPQTITVTGSGFQSGLTARLTGPGGTGSAVRGDVSSITFQIVAVLAEAGSYTLQVTNPDGQASNVFSFTVGAAAPAITGVSPASPKVSTAAQTITVTGSGFQSGLTARLTSPGGTVSASVQNVSSTGFQIVAVLAAPGNYALLLTNPDGQTSNIFTFTVTAVI